MVAVWNAETGKQIGNFVGLRHYVTAIALSADGGRIAASSRADLAADGSTRMRPAGQIDQVRVWDVSSALVVNLSGADVEQANALAVSADGKRLVTGSGKLVVRFWDLNDGRLIHTLGNQRAPIGRRLWPSAPMDIGRRTRTTSTPLRRATWPSKSLTRPTDN